MGWTRETLQQWGGGGMRLSCRTLRLGSLGRSLVQLGHSLEMGEGSSLGSGGWQRLEGLQGRLWGTGAGTWVSIGVSVVPPVHEEGMLDGSLGLTGEQRLEGLQEHRSGTGVGMCQLLDEG